MLVAPTRLLVALLLTLSLVAGAALAAPAETAKPSSLDGRVTLNKSTRVGPKTEFKEGDQISVSPGARMTIRLPDGAELDLVGPAQLEILQLHPEGNRVKLVSGYISSAYVKGVALEIQTPYGPSLVLQNSTARARVAPGDKVLFQRIEGSYLKVYENINATSLKSEDLTTTWTKSLRGSSAAPVEGDDPLADDSARIKLGERYVTYSPASQFSKEDRAEGVTRLTYNGDGYGRVDVGIGTVLFVAPGEFVDFDANGDVVGFSGISHIYHPIDEFAFYDEPIENAADASIADPRRR